MRLSRALFTIALATCVTAPNAAFAKLGAEDALELARGQWFEGIPEERLDTLSKQAEKALAELLEDPDEAEHHATAIDLLGHVGGRSAFKMIVGYEREAAAQAEALPDNLLPAAIHRARMAVPIALGRIAARDAKAVKHLMQGAQRNGPRWRTQRLSEPRVERVYRELWALGLGLSGHPDAPGALRRMQAPGNSESWRQHIENVIALHRPAHAGTGRGNR